MNVQINLNNQKQIGDNAVSCMIWRVVNLKLIWLNNNPINI